MKVYTIKMKSKYKILYIILISGFICFGSSPPIWKTMVYQNYRSRFHAQIFAYNNAVATTITKQDSFYVISVFDSTGDLDGFTKLDDSAMVATAPDLALIHCFIFWHVTGSPELPATTYEFAVFRNSTMEYSTAMKRYFAANDIGALSGCGYLSGLTTMDTLTLRVANRSSTGDFTTIDASLTILGH